MEIVPPSSVVKLEVFVGKKCTGECPSAAFIPNMLPRPVDGAYIVSDPQPWTEPVEGATVGYRIAVASDVTIGMIAIVGYAQDGTIAATSVFHDVEVSATKSELWRVDNLEPAGQIGDGANPPAGTHRVKTWHAANFTLPTCIVFEEWGDSSVTRDLLGPEADTDCDGVSHECDPWWYLAPLTLPTLATSSCVSFTNVGTSSVCSISGPQCSETGGSVVPCVPLRPLYCLPYGLCAACQTTDMLDTCLEGSFRNSLSTTAPMAHLECKIPLDENGNPCGGSTELDGGSYLTNGVSCTAIRISDLAAPFGPFTTKLAIDNGKLELSNFRGPCKVDVAFEGTATAGGRVGFAELELSNGRHLVVPAKLELLGNACGQTSQSCVFTSAQSDTLLDCVAAPAANACQPSGSCASGAACNGMCCGPGEQCVNGTCKCGTAAACSGGNTCQSMVAEPDQCGTVCCGVTPCPV